MVLLLGTFKNLVGASRKNLELWLRRPIPMTRDDNPKVQPRVMSTQ